MGQEINFEQFIKEHEEKVFLKGGKLIPCTVRYRKKIHSLNQQLNLLLSEDEGEIASDPVLLLGLFAMAIESFGPTVKTDVEQYREDFLEFVASE